MSDLISRSELLKAFNNKNVQITFDLPVEEVLGEDVDLDDFAMLVQDAVQAYKKMAIDTIKNQPTAYSVAKVVEKLEEAECNVMANMLFDNIIKEKPKELGQLIAYDKAIEIVKQGGVSDDVCEWHCDMYGRYHTECHILTDNDPLEYTYCPYCGKKIKEVE